MSQKPMDVAANDPKVQELLWNLSGGQLNEAYRMFKVPSGGWESYRDFRDWFNDVAIPTYKRYDFAGEPERQQKISQLAGITVDWNKQVPKAPVNDAPPRTQTPPAPSTNQGVQSAISRYIPGNPGYRGPVQTGAPAPTGGAPVSGNGAFPVNRVGPGNTVMPNGWGRPMTPTQAPGPNLSAIADRLGLNRGGTNIGLNTPQRYVPGTTNNPVVNLINQIQGRTTTPVTSRPSGVGVGNGVETQNPDGTVTVRYPNGSVTTYHPPRGATPTPTPTTPARGSTNNTMPRGIVDDPAGYPERPVQSNRQQAIAGTGLGPFAQYIQAQAQAGAPVTNTNQRWNAPYVPPAPVARPPVARPPVARPPVTQPRPVTPAPVARPPVVTTPTYRPPAQQPATRIPSAAQTSFFPKSAYPVSLGGTAVPGTPMYGTTAPRGEKMWLDWRKNQQR